MPPIYIYMAGVAAPAAACEEVFLRVRSSMQARLRAFSNSVRFHVGADLRELTRDALNSLAEMLSVPEPALQKRTELQRRVLWEILSCPTAKTSRDELAVALFEAVKAARPNFSGKVDRVGLDYNGAWKPPASVVRSCNASPPAAAKRQAVQQSQPPVQLVAAPTAAEQELEETAADVGANLSLAHAERVAAEQQTRRAANAAEGAAEAVAEVYDGEADGGLLGIAQHAREAQEQRDWADRCVQLGSGEEIEHVPIHVVAQQIATINAASSATTR